MKYTVVVKTVVEFCNEVKSQEPRMMGLFYGERITTICSVILIQHRSVTDRQTD